jgi:hypothetical protein
MRSDRTMLDYSTRMSTATVRTSATRASSEPGAYSDALLHVAALSIVAGSIHAVAAAPHLREYWLFGTFFCAVALVQLGWGAWIYGRPSPVAFRAGIAVNLGVITVWIASRTVGLPLGSEHWRAETVGPLDLAATAAEALVVALCVAFLSTAGRAATAGLPSRFRRLQPLAMATMLGALLVLFLGGGHHVH